MIGRFALLLMTAMAVAWLILGLRAIHLERTGVAEGLASQGSDPVALARARQLLARAAALSADQQPELLEVQLLVFAGRRRAALALVRRVNVEEPANVTAWRFALRLARELGRPRVAADARARLRTLSPPIR